MRRGCLQPHRVVVAVAALFEVVPRVQRSTREDIHVNRKILYAFTPESLSAPWRKDADD